MIENTKPVDHLQVSDLQANAVWRYRSGTKVVPVRRVPVADLTGKVVGTQIVLANGEKVWALIGNISVSNPRMTEHFLTLSVKRKGCWFGLARYHDFDFSERGPRALATFLGRRIDEVFPISYDVRRYVKGENAALCGQIHSEPRERLSRAEIIAMAVP